MHRQDSKTRRLVQFLATASVALLAFSAPASARTLPELGYTAAKAHRPTFAPAGSTTAFGLDLMRRLGGGNLVLSPDSISTALAMTGTGAHGTTASQIASTLRLASPAAFTKVGDLQHEIAAEQAKAAGDDPEAPTLELADTLFLQSGFALGPPFLAGLQQHFDSSPQLVDFESHSSEATQSVNSWVSEHTHGLIPTIVSSLPSTTRLVLANAIYLKAAWAQPFKTNDTAPGSFHRTSGSVSVPFMHETEDLRYAQGHGYQAVSIPYRSSTLSLLVLLPNGQSAGALLRRLDQPRLNEIAHRLRSVPVQLSLPKFHVNLKAQLNETLAALGMRIPFTSAADFSAISASQPLQIGAVDHAADFTVDEAGTVAAAATTVTIEATSARGFERRPVVFNANRPFLFFLRDDRTGTLLFAGRLADPST